MVIALAVVAAMGVMLAGTPAQALLVKNDGNTIFDSGGFENDVAGFAPAAASSGTWEWAAINYGASFNVSTDASPGPNEGSQYLTVDKTSLPNSGYIRANFASAATTGSVNMQWKTYVDSTAGVSGTNYYICGPGTGTGGAKFFFTMGADGVLTSDINGTGSGIPDVVPVDKWITAEFDYVLGADSFDLTLDGTTTNVSLDGPKVHEAGNFDGKISNFAGLLIRDGGGSSTFKSHIDSIGGVIPEPASLSLLGLGGLMLLRRRR
jgi:hypothetical protein